MKKYFVEKKKVCVIISNQYVLEENKKGNNVSRCFCILLNVFLNRRKPIRTLLFAEDVIDYKIKIKKYNKGTAGGRVNKTVYNNTSGTIF